MSGRARLSPSVEGAILLDDREWGNIRLPPYHRLYPLRYRPTTVPVPGSRGSRRRGYRLVENVTLPADR